MTPHGQKPRGRSAQKARAVKSETHSAVESKQPLRMPVAALPSGWRWRTLGDVTEERVSQGGPEGESFSYVDISSVDNTAKAIVGARNLSVADAPSRARQRLAAGDVLVSMTRPNLNAVALVPAHLDGAIGSTGFHVLRGGPEVDARWLFYAVRSTDFVQAMSGLVQGALYPAVRPKDVRAFPIPVPPLSAQRAILSALDEVLSGVDAATAGLERARANCRRMRSAVLRAAADGTLVADSAHSARRKGPEPWSPDVPAHWDFKTVDELSDLVEYGTSAKTSAGAGDAIPVLRMGNIVEGHLVWDQLKYLPSTHDEFPGLLLQPGDVLFNRTNSPELVGKTAVFTTSHPRASFASYLLRVRLKPTMLPSFFSAFVNSMYGRAWVASVVTQQVGQANVNGTKLRALKVPCPSLEEQHAIVRVLEDSTEFIARAEKALGVQLARASRLRQSILKSAFDGRLVRHGARTATVDRTTLDLGDAAGPSSMRSSPGSLRYRQ